MKKLVLIVAVGAMALLLGSCSSVGYVSDWDAHHDFSRDGTFAWYRLPQRHDRGTLPNTIIASRIRRAVTGELSQRGFRPAAVHDADLLITYHIALQRNMQVYHGGWGYPYRGCWGWGRGYTSARMVTKGTLIIDVLDGKKRGLVWRGIAEGAFSRPNPSDADIAKIVSRMLAGFPVR